VPRGPDRRAASDRSVPGHHDPHDAHDNTHRGDGHSHGRVDPSIVRSRHGVRTVLISLAVLMVVALIQVGIFVLSGSVALLADLIHNVGDALTGVPLGVAFATKSPRGERWAGLVIVAGILASPVIAGTEAIERPISPQLPTHLLALAFAGRVGVAGNEIGAQVRLHGGRRIGSAALVADGKHARVDSLVSAGVIASVSGVAVGIPIADPLIGLEISAVLIEVTRDSWQVLSHDTDAATRPDRDGSCDR
jgi:cation diffusion facilitator family transporter